MSQFQSQHFSLTSQGLTVIVHLKSPNNSLHADLPLSQLEFNVLISLARLDWPLAVVLILIFLF